jgi:hypothetical protein
LCVACSIEIKPPSQEILGDFFRILLSEYNFSVGARTSSSVAMTYSLKISTGVPCYQVEDGKTESIYSFTCQSGKTIKAAGAFGGPIRRCIRINPRTEKIAIDTASHAKLRPRNGSKPARRKRKRSAWHGHCLEQKQTRFRFHHSIER